MDDVIVDGCQTDIAQCTKADFRVNALKLINIALFSI